MLNSTTQSAPSHAEEATRIFSAQADAIRGLAERVNGDFDRAVELILAATGRIVVCGMGKSGIIGKKIAATFASTGTPSFFMHPAEAYHGDLGMIKRNDVLLLISYSGETEEVVRLIPSLRDFGVKVISLVGVQESTLGRNSDAVLDISVEREVCPNNLAPTSSTLTTLAMGDALGVVLMKERGFCPTDFARFHPGGSLGRRLLTRVKDAMHKGSLPRVAPTATVRESLLTITQGRLGLTLVMDAERLVGIVTDGDLRRAMLKYDNFLDLPISRIMHPEPHTIAEDAMLVDAEQRMKSLKIKALVAVDADERVTGVLEIFDE